MERIIITEVDNTSNVESLSSYDVVYVPGFSNNGASPLFEQGTTLFRTPTLVTSKYEFLQLFGQNGKDVCPTFPKDQPYPIAELGTETTTGKYGFPSYAIPNYVEPVNPTDVQGIKNINYATATGTTEKEKIVSAVTSTENYTYVDTTTTETSTNGWIPAAGVIYYLAAKDGGATQTVTMYALTDQYTYTEVPANWKTGTGVNPVLKQWYEHTGTGTTHADYTATTDITVVAEKSYYYRDYGALYVFTSNVSPVTQGWYTNAGTTEKPNWVVTDDTYIAFDSDAEGNLTTVKTYYKTSVILSMMFNGPRGTELGDADPGYRYALYLLSLGIPVYYEQMNSSFALIDFNDGNYTVVDGKVVDASQTVISPQAKGWFTLISDDYVRTDDTSIPATVDAAGHITISSGPYYRGADISVKSMYEGLEARFAKVTSEDDDARRTSGVDYSFDNIGDYSIKYFTTGGYPVYEYGPLVYSQDLKRNVGSSPIAQDMIKLAKTRGDAVALIDHTNNPDRTIYEVDKLSVINRIRNDDLGNLDTTEGSYGAMFTPWYNCISTVITGGTSKNYQNQMPGSLAFLSALARQLNNYNPWLAVAGVSRGPVPYCAGLHTNFTLTNNVADSYQNVPDGTISTTGNLVSINPVTYIRDVGYCVWGNRTLRNNTNGTQSTSFLNIRDLLSDIKKTLYAASQKLMFEQNSDMLWLNFKSAITPLLDSMKSNAVLQDYTIKKYNVDPETGQDVPAYKLLAIIQVQPINSIEVFQLEVQIENADFTVAEVE